MAGISSSKNDGLDTSPNHPNEKFGTSDDAHGLEKVETSGDADAPDVDSTVSSSKAPKLDQSSSHPDQEVSPPNGSNQNQEEELSSIPKEQEPSSIPTEQEPSSTAKGEEPSSIPKEEGPSSIPKEEEPSSIPKEEEPSSIPKEEEPSSISKEQEPSSISKEQEPSSTSKEQEVKDDSHDLKSQEADSSVDPPKKESDTVADPHEAPVEDDSSILKEQAVDSSLTHSDKVDGSGVSEEAHGKGDPSTTKEQAVDSSLTHSDKVDGLGDSNEAHGKDDPSITKDQAVDSSLTHSDKVDGLGDSEEAHVKDDPPSIPKTEEKEPTSTDAEVEVEVDTLGDAIVAYIDVEIESANLDLHPFLEFKAYRVNNVIVGRDRRVLFHNFAEQLIRRQDIRYQGFEWDLQFAWTNETSATNTYTRTVTEGLRVLEGTTTESNFGIGAGFRGLSFTAGGSTKRFSERETSRTVEIRKEVRVPPRSRVLFYQKRYIFRTEVWFWQHVPAWTTHNPFGVGRNGDAERIVEVANTDIQAEEYATLHRELSGNGNLSAVYVPAPTDDPRDHRQFNNITKQARNMLNRWGIRG